MKEQYPEEMTVVLQHQFWDLAVSDAHFEVALSFNGVSEKLHVPFEAIKGFFDPSVQFGLQFEPQRRGARGAAEKPALAEKKAARPRRKPVAEEDAPAAVGPAEPAKPARSRARKASPRRQSPVAPVARTRLRPSPTSRTAAPKWCGSIASGRNSLRGRVRFRGTAEPPRNPHRQAVERPQGHARERKHLRALRERDAETPGDHHKREQHLLHRKAHADADARARAERQIGKARDLSAVLRRESAPGRTGRAPPTACGAGAAPTAR